MLRHSNSHKPLVCDYPQMDIIFFSLEIIWPTQIGLARTTQLIYVDWLATYVCLGVLSIIFCLGHFGATADLKGIGTITIYGM